MKISNINSTTPTFHPKVYIRCIFKGECHKKSCDFCYMDLEPKDHALVSVHKILQIRSCNAWGQFTWLLPFFWEVKSTPWRSSWIHAWLHIALESNPLQLFHLGVQVVPEPERALKELSKTPCTLFQCCPVHGLCCLFVAESHKNNKELKLEAELSEMWHCWWTRSCWQGRKEGRGTLYWPESLWKVSLY